MIKQKLKKKMFALAALAALSIAGAPNIASAEVTPAALAYEAKMFPGYHSDFWRTDPEFVDRFNNFAYDEVVNHDDLDDKTRFLAILATLMGSQSIDEYRAMTVAALNFGVEPVAIKETVYQASAYLGMGRVLPFLLATNEILEQRGVKLPLPTQATTTRSTRREKGTEVQVEVFGERMKEFYRSGNEETRHINYWLAANCFGDWYTRGGLDLQERELITFCFLMAQGGCEPQLTSHAVGNMRVGNDKETLIKVVTQCLPYIGYPRTLNALRCINDADSTYRAELAAHRDKDKDDDEEK